jgi:hypothetical protein
MASKLTKLISYSMAGVVSAALAVFAVSCGDDKKDDEKASTTTTLKYADVSSTITTYCATSGCHDAAGASASGSYDMTTQAKTKTKASTAAARMENSSNPMPPVGSQKTALDAATTAKANLLAWLKAGAPE